MGYAEMPRFNRLWLVSYLAFTAATPAAEPNTTPSKPNIIYIMADDLGYGDLGCYGQERIRTPKIDRMSAEGMRFTQCYAGSTVCAVQMHAHDGYAHWALHSPRQWTRTPAPAGSDGRRAAERSWLRDGTRRQMGAGRKQFDRRPKQKGVRLLLSASSTRLMHTTIIRTSCGGMETRSSSMATYSR